MTTKFCKPCNKHLTLDRFTVDRHRPDGLNAYCKDCRLAERRRARGTKPERYFANLKTYASPAEKTRAWRERNPESHAASIARRDPGKLSAAHKRWRDKNVDRERARVAEWTRRNPESSARSGALRRAAERRACPVWADRSEMNEWYLLAEVMSRGGVKFTVDHIVPLRSKRVCGLHAQSNFQLLTSFANSSKSNRFWPDMA